MDRRSCSKTILGAVWLTVAACGTDGGEPSLMIDASNVGANDASIGSDASRADAATQGPDAGAPGMDAGMSTPDAASSAEAGVSLDANVGATDSSVPGDAGTMSDTGPAPGDAATPPHPGDTDKSILPIVFLHGFSGSASQFDSQAQRLVANGYPPNKLRALDHDGAALTTTQFVAPLDQIVDGLLSEFGVTQVYLIGHSRGTFLVKGYVGDASRAKKVAKIILIDGDTCPATPMCDAPNRGNLPGQAHVEAATSAESFKRQYKFLFGKEPSVADIVAQTEPVLISGRAVNFPANTGRSGATLTAFELGAKGERVGDALITKAIDASGDWGPLQVSPDKHYEFALTLENGAVQHYYFQRFLRSTKFIRLLSGPIDSPSRMNTNVGPNHAALTLLRMREWYTTDTLQIKVTRPAGETITPNAITSAVENTRIAIYLHDDKATPGMTTLKPLPYFPSQPFQTGLDVFMPAAEQPDGTITVTNNPRGDAGKPQVLNMPNWASSKHSISLYFADYAQ